MINKAHVYTPKKAYRIRGDSIIKAVAVFAISLVISRVSLFDGLYPFGLAFLAALASKQRKDIPMACLGLAAGFLSLDLGSYALKYIAAAVLFFAIVFILEVKKLAATPWLIGGIIFGTSFISGWFYVDVTNPIAFDFALTVFESMLITVLALLFAYALPISATDFTGNLTFERAVSVSMIVATAMTGLSDVTVYGLSLQNITIVLVLLVLSIFSFGLSTSGATVIGVICSFTSAFEPVIVGVLAFGSLLAGIFKEMGRIGVVIGFFIGTGLMNLYINGHGYRFLSLREMLIASGIFLLIPHHRIMYLKSIVEPFHRKVSYSSINEKLLDLMSLKLKEYSGILEELALSFRRVMKKEKNSMLDNSGLMKMYEEIMENVCSKCSGYTKCWEKDFYNSYMVFLDLISAAEGKDGLTPQDLPGAIKNRCYKVDNILNNINFMINSYRIKVYWQEKVIESKKLVAEQLEGMAKIVKDLSLETKSRMRLRHDVEEKILKEFGRKGIDGNVIAVEIEKNKVEVYVEKSPCKGNRECMTKAVPVITEILGKKVIVKNCSCGLKKGTSTCSLKLTGAQTYQVAVGTAFIPKEGRQESGDTFSFKELKNGNYMLAISDGMGTGKKAAMESSDTVSLLEHLLEAGCDKEIAIRTINSTLSLRSTEETFSTIDLALVDLYNARATFLKIGSPPSFIKRNGKVEVISSASLPVGILDEVDINQVSIKLKPGDFIVMISDGVLENHFGLKNPGEWLRFLIKNKDTKNPQELAEYILEKAVGNNKPRDDMTVLVAKLWKRV